MLDLEQREHLILFGFVQEGTPPVVYVNQPISLFRQTNWSKLPLVLDIRDIVVTCAGFFPLESLTQK